MTLEELSIIISISAEEALQELDKLNATMEKFAEKQKTETKKAFDAAPATEFGKVAKAAIDNYGSATKDVMKDVIKKLNEAKDTGVSLAGVFKGIGGSIGSIFSGGTIGLILQAISWIPTIIEGIASAGEKAREEERRQEEERKQAILDAATTEEERLASLREYNKQYNELWEKPDRTMEDMAEMSDLRRKLAQEHGIEVAAVAHSVEEYNLLNAAIEQCEERTLASLLLKQEGVTQSYMQEAREATEELFKNTKELETIYAQLAESPELSEMAFTNWQVLTAELQKMSVNDLTFLQNVRSVFTDMLIELAATGEDTPVTLGDVMDRMLTIDQSKLAENSSKFTEVIKGSLQEAMTELSQEGVDVPQGIVDGMGEILTSNFHLEKYLSLEGTETGIAGMKDKIKELFSDTEMLASIQTLWSTLSGANNGEFNEENLAAFKASWENVFGKDGPMMSTLGEWIDLSTEAGQQATRSLVSIALGLGGMDGTATTAADALRNTAAAMGEVEEEAPTMGESFDQVMQDAKILGTTYADLTKRFGEVTGQRKAAAEWKKLRQEYDNLQKEGKDASGTLVKMNQVLEESGKQTKVTGENMGELDASMTEMETAADAAGAAFVSDIEGMIVSLQDYQSQLALEGVMGGVDNSAAISAINGVIMLLNLMLSKAKEGGIKLDGDGSSGKGRGGGGGKKDDPKRAAEEAARAAEEARRERIQKDYDEIAHRRHMNEITLEEELSMLAAIRENHKLNAEEIMEWEEKIFDLKKELRDRDAASLDALNDGVIEALTNRYEAMRDAELERLDASREAWEKWRDDSVRAIEDQIAALDKLADTEDREKKDAEELRKIEKLRRDVAFEQDEYNRMKLQQQLDAAMESREERLRKLDLQDQKEALRGEIDKINEQADGKLSGLDQEQEKLEAAYDERLKAAALQAEAERMIMQKDQMEMLALLRDFAPEYDAIGKSMGERLLDGFTKKIATGAAGWFETFNGWISQLQEQTAQVALAGVDPLYDSYAKQANAAKGAVTVNQSVSFNEPVLLGFYTDGDDCGLLVVVCGCGYGYVGFADAGADADTKAGADAKADADNINIDINADTNSDPADEMLPIVYFPISDLHLDTANI